MIDRLLAGRAHAPAWLVIDAGDDAALLRGGQVVTTDTLVEGVHFDARTPPADVGFKSVAVSVSDVAAMGATPTWMMCALSLPRGGAVLPWVDHFAEGLAEACAAFGVYLMGGDVTSTPPGGPRFVSHTVAGQVDERHVLDRASAEPGDDLWVTGPIGLAGVGWMADDPPPAALAALRRPRPPLRFARDLAASGLASAAMDLSDGLSIDLPRLAAASGVHIRLDPAALWVHPALRRHPQRDRALLHGGDDYQLVFTAPPPRAAAIQALADQHQVTLRRVGSVQDGAGTSLPDGTWPQGGFAHFSAEDAS